MRPIHLYDLGREALCELLARWGYSHYHAERVWAYLYRADAHTLDEMDGLRADLQARLQAETTLRPLAERLQLESGDGRTQKFLLGLPDGETIETVVMRFNSRRRADTRRYTACVSTQAGCAMGCLFCATGQMGFVRHLTAGEIVGQVVYANRKLAAQGEALRNVVLMGMGEPLHNYENTMRAVDIITDDKGLAIAPRHVTLSTVGIPAGIRRLADENRPLRLAVSLHGATDAERQALVPPARRWPLAELLAACRTYSRKRGQKIFFEWTLIAGENDTPEQAHALGRLLQGMHAHVNVIPLNPTGGYAGRPSDPRRVRAFQDILSTYDIPSTVRQRRGIDIAAGCGQLRQRETAQAG